jgi:hypothetical protein
MIGKNAQSFVDRYGSARIEWHEHAVGVATKGRTDLPEWQRRCRLSHCSVVHDAPNFDSASA